MTSVNKAHLYELRTKKISDDLAFYKRYLSPDKRILEVGVGTGRIILELHKSGYGNIFGVEICDEYYNLGKENSTQSGFSWDNRVIKGDFLEYPEEHEFDFVLFPFNVFHEFVTLEAKISALTKARKILKTQGQIVVICFSPDYKNWSKEKVQHSFDIGAGEDQWKCEILSQRDYIAQVANCSVKYSNSVGEVVLDDYKISLVTQNELYALYKATNLKLVREYGSLQAEDFSLKSDYMIHILERE